MKIVIRQPRKNEAREAARLVLLAWPIEQFIDESKGETYEKLEAMISRTIEMENTLYSYKNILVAEAIDDENSTKNQLVGALCGYDGDMYHQLKTPVLEVLQLDQNSVWGRTDETKGGEYYLDSIGVDAHYRGLGIATKLFQQMFEKIKSLGFHRTGLIVDVDKPKAEALYARIGFKFDEYRTFMGEPFKHMTKEL